MSLVFWHSLRSHRLVLLLMALAIIGFGILITTSFQSVGDQQSAILENLPRGIQALLKTEGSKLLASGARGYIGIGFRHPLVLIFFSAFAIATASGAIAKEIERKTSLLLLARPLPRYYLVLGKIAESCLGGLALVSALLIGTLLGIAIAGLEGSVTLGPLLVMGFNALCLYLAILGYSYLISAVSSDEGRAIMLSTALTVVFFFIDFMSTLFDVLQPLGYISIFHYYDPGSIAIEGIFPSLAVGILLTTALVTMAASLVVFQRRDIAV